MSRARCQGLEPASLSERSSHSKASRSCNQTVALSACATWREDQEGSPRHCGLIVGSMGSIFAEKALFGSRAMTTSLTKSGGASGSALRGTRTASCAFIFGTIRSSVVQDRSKNKGLPHTAQAKGPRHEDPDGSHLSR